MISLSNRLKNKGVSPVIGVILMVALVIALVALNENGDTAAGFYSNNPEWEVITPNGINQIKGYDNVYDVWVKVTMEFDYANNEVTYTVVDQDSGKTRQTTVDMRTDSSDIDKIAIENHENQDANMYMWFDSISVGETEN